MKYVMVFFALLALVSCADDSTIEIKTQEDLERLLPNDYIKINYNSENLDLKNCDSLLFAFNDVQVVKVSKSEFQDISSKLISSKLKSVQNKGEADIIAEYRGYKFCMNSLGQVFRNNRALVDNPELVYAIKLKAKYFNQFKEEDLQKKDSLISKYGLPFSYKYVDPAIKGVLDDKDSLRQEIQNYRTHYNIILTF